MISRKRIWYGHHINRAALTYFYSMPTKDISRLEVYLCPLEKLQTPVGRSDVELWGSESQNGKNYKFKIINGDVMMHN